MGEQGKMNRRQFVNTSAAAMAATIVPRHVLGGSKFVTPSDKINVGLIGCGTQALRMIFGYLRHEKIRITSVCDCNKNSQDYPEWGRFGLRNQFRRELNDPDWGENDTGCRCGRDIGKYVVDTFYAQQAGKESWAGVSAYEDFRDMLADENDVDGVWVMTPEHTHGIIAYLAMQEGKHVIMHKPLSNVLSEAHILAELAKKTGLATHLYCSSDNQTTPLIKEWIDAGAIGTVREVHNWSNRPVWPQGWTEYPKETPPVPDGFNWDLWLGPAEERPYHPLYTHTNFRGWYDFGTGSMGDMGHYSSYQIWQILELGFPKSVEAHASHTVRMTETLQTEKITDPPGFPLASTAHWEIPRRNGEPDIDLFWYDGGMKPPLPKELEEDGRSLDREGLLIVGDEGKLYADFSGGSPRLIPEKKMQAFDRPPKTLPRPIGELDQWIRACEGKKPADANFVTMQPVSDTLLLGTVGLRVPGKLYYDAENMNITNSDEADKLLYRKNRKGWELA